MLVVVMILYHAMNFFTTAGAETFVYIRFVSGSFIILSGYIIGHFEEKKFAIDRMGVSRRLIWRGAKLLLLFTALNMAIALGGFGNPEKMRPGFVTGDLFNIYITGGLGRASFQILLPIAYLLILSPALLMFRASAKALLAMTIGAAAVLSLVVDADFVNVEFLLLGIIGLYGSVVLNAYSAPSSLREPWRIGVALCATTLAMKWLVLNLATYALGTILIMKLLHDAALAARTEGRAIESLALLGRYSLFSYVAQIIILQVAWRALGRPKWDLGYELALITGAATLLLYVVVSFVSWIRRRYRQADQAYNAVFK